MTRRLAIVALIALAPAFVGCAGRLPLAVATSGSSPDAHELDATPFFPQVTHQCGPAALATLLGASGVDTTPAALVPAVYVPSLHGSLQVELLAASRRAGRIPYAIEPTLDAIVDEIDAGRPVLVLQNLGFTLVPRWHYAVVVGYSRADERLVLRSGRTRRQVVSTARFAKTWSRAGDWGIVALAPGDLPARVDAKPYVTAVSAFEAANEGRAALPAWERALERWPDDDDALFAFGNALLTNGDARSAEQCYGALIARRPDHLGARNNLAMLLAQRGCADAARATLAPALESMQQGDSAWTAVLQASSAEIDGLPADEARCARESVEARSCPVPHAGTE
jgi:hypothetical protein